MCWGEQITITVVNSEGEPVGEIAIDMFQAIHLHAIGREFGENLKIFKVSRSGETPADLVIYLTGWCSSPCSTTIHFPEGSVPKAGLSGTISHKDAIAAGKMHSTYTHYQLDFTAPGYIELKPGNWKSPISYRCVTCLEARGRVRFPKVHPNAHHYDPAPPECGRLLRHGRGWPRRCCLARPAGMGR